MSRWRQKNCSVFPPTDCSVSNSINKNLRKLYKLALEMFDKMGGVAEDISDAEMSNG